MDGSYPGVPAVGDWEEPLCTQLGHGGAGVAQPQARTLKAQSRAASGGGAEEMGPQEGHPAGASEGHLGEETGHSQQVRPSTQGDVGSGSLGCRWGKG